MEDHMRGRLCQAVIHLGGSLPASNLYCRTIAQKTSRLIIIGGEEMCQRMCVWMRCRITLKHKLNNTTHAGHMTLQ